MNRGLMLKAYAVLMPLAALSVVVQAILFAGRYSEGQAWYLTAHMHLGSASLLIVVICLGLAIFGKFPQATRILPLTGILVLLWLGQYLLGEYTTDKVRWPSFLHIPMAFIVFGLAAMLSGRAHRLMGGKYADAGE